MWSSYTEVGGPKLYLACFNRKFVYILPESRTIAAGYACARNQYLPGAEEPPDGFGIYCPQRPPPTREKRNHQSAASLSRYAEVETGGQHRYVQTCPYHAVVRHAMNQ